MSGYEEPRLAVSQMAGVALVFFVIGFLTAIAWAS